MIDGVIVVDKPIGITSFEVVRRVRRAARIKKIGHGGTLDPLASGVLPVCLGEATKLAQFLLDADKEYEVTLCLGVETDTFDAGGTVVARRDPAAVGEGDVRAALPALTGSIQQVPPAFSALKRDGRPLYDYARAGEPVTAAARTVVVHELELAGWAGPEAVSLRVRCSKGTYIRSLVADLGRALGPGAHVTALRRTRSGPFGISAATPLTPLLESLAMPSAPVAVVKPADALGHLPHCFVEDPTAADLERGRRVPWSALPASAPVVGRFRILRPDGSLLAVAERRPDDSVRTVRVFGRAALRPAR
jgi:tRNA pseudouridine55 synthase